MRWTVACSLAFLACSACGGARERPEPPSGAVDPGPAGLAEPGREAGRPGAAGAVPHLGGLPAAGRAGGGEAPGKITVTREHCQTLGRKFAEMAMAQGGAEDGPVDGEAANMGQTFAGGCVRDLVGQQVEAAEYQCMLRAKAPQELIQCRR